MSTLQQEIERFHDFATERAQAGKIDSLQELLDLWHAEHPPHDELAESLESLQRGLDDAEAGRIQPDEEVIAELRTELASGK